MMPGAAEVRLVGWEGHECVVNNIGIFFPDHADIAELRERSVYTEIIEGMGRYESINYELVLNTFESRNRSVDASAISSSTIAALAKSKSRMAAPRFAIR